MREVSVRVGLVLGSVALMALALEVGLRLGERTPWRSTGLVGVARSASRPDTGSAVAELEMPAKRGGAFRIVVVGDSVTWGSGIHPEDAYPERLGRRLARLESDREIEVVNWSRAGWNTVREWRSLEGKLDRLDPDLLILGYSLNDPEPDRVRVDLRMQIERRRPVSGPGIWLYERSCAFRLVFDRLENSRQRRASDAYYARLYENDTPERRRQLDALAQWSAEMARRGIPMALVIFPMFDSQLGSSYHYAHLHAQMADLGRELGLAVLDLLPQYEGVDARRLAVEPFTDSHPNELAHRIAADVLLGWLVQRELLPLRSSEPPAGRRTLWASRRAEEVTPPAPTPLPDSVAPVGR